MLHCKPEKLLESMGDLRMASTFLQASSLYANVPLPPTQIFCSSTSLNLVASTEEQQSFPLPKKWSSPPTCIIKYMYTIFRRFSDVLIKTTQKFLYEAYCLIRRILQKPHWNVLCWKLSSLLILSAAEFRGEQIQPSYLSLIGRLSLANPTLHLWFLD